MQLSKETIRETIITWFSHWNRQDLDSVIELFDDDVIFENWHNRTLKGKNSIRRAWAQEKDSIFYFSSMEK